jgi:TPR repeat protein
LQQRANSQAILPRRKSSWWWTERKQLIDYSFTIALLLISLFALVIAVSSDRAARDAADSMREIKNAARDTAASAREIKRMVAMMFSARPQSDAGRNSTHAASKVAAERPIRHLSPEANFDAGYAYMNGDTHHIKSPRLALRYFTKAYYGGYIGAATNIGVLFQRGELGVDDHGNALKWFLRDARKGQSVAEYNYAVVIEDMEAGEATEADRQKYQRIACGWLSAAAQQGYKIAITNFARRCGESQAESPTTSPT